jgi:thioesterase domain-containing protein/acyl carrier protein
VTTLTEPIPARTNLERELVRIWEQVLDRAPIGMQDDFFDLGGSSVQAAKIFARIEESFQRRLPVSVILAAPTIEQLGAALLPGKIWDQKAYIVPIQTRGQKPALYCVGGGAAWRAVSEHLGPSQPVFSIGLEPDAVEHIKDAYPMETLARHMVSALCRKQPKGPYYLCGYCQDGIFAYEVARQLAFYGHEVGLLALIEARNPSAHFRVRAVNGLRRTAIRLGFQFHQLYQLFRKGDFPRYLHARRGELKRFRLRMSSRFSSDFQFRGRQSGRIDLQEFLYLQASFSKPKPLGCPTAIFRCADWPILSAGDPYFGWREFLNGASEIHEVPGIHDEVFHEPNVRVLAKKLGECLRNASRKETQTPHEVMNTV